MEPRSIGPTAPEERITLVDVLRGFALFGILLVNIRGLAAPQNAPLLLAGQPWWASLDGLVRALTLLLADGKFITMFTILFGLGFAMQMDRAAARGEDGARLYRRRLWWLLGLGVAHALLLWSGDVLALYALTGFLLLRFRRTPPGRLLWWSAGLLLAPILVTTVLFGHAAGATPPAIHLEGYSAWAGENEFFLRAFGRGSYLTVFLARLFEWITFLVSYTISGGIAQIPGMFLLGLYAGRTGLLSDPGHRLAQIRNWALPVGLTGAGLYFWAAVQRSTGGFLWSEVLFLSGYSLGGVGLGTFYATALVLLYRRAGWQERLAFLAAPGRMALTNYLAQSLLCTTLFYSYGLGLYGKVGPTGQLAIALGVMVLEVGWSHWWLKRHRYGPVEWLWRRLTYPNRGS